jgi:hypothetical protein
MPEWASGGTNHITRRPEYSHSSTLTPYRILLNQHKQFCGFWQQLSQKSYKRKKLAPVGHYERVHWRRMKKLNPEREKDNRCWSAPEALGREVSNQKNDGVKVRSGCADDR